MVDGLQPLFKRFNLFEIPSFHIQLFKGEIGHLFYFGGDDFLSLLNRGVLKHILNILLDFCCLGVLGFVFNLILVLHLRRLLRRWHDERAHEAEVV